MASAKDIVVKPIASADARPFVERHHYSGKVLNNSQLNFGAFIDSRLVGVMQYGPPMVRAKVLPLVIGTKWYLGKSRAGSIVIDAPPVQGGEGGAEPTPALQSDQA